jgi:hypothetical protein
MWTLILVTFIVSGASTGGVGTARAFLDFPDEAKCRTAAETMSRTDHVTVGPVGPHPNISPSAIYALLLGALRADPSAYLARRFAAAVPP